MNIYQQLRSLILPTLLLVILMNTTGCEEGGHKSELDVSPPLTPPVKREPDEPTLPPTSGSPEPDEPIVSTELEDVLKPFNLHSISVSDVVDSKPYVNLSWDNAQPSESQVDVSYTICERDTGSENMCKEIGHVVNTLSVSIKLSSLITALDSNYFIIAKASDFTLETSEMSIGLSELNKMVGYFKASNTHSGNGYGNAIAISTDGLILAVAALEEGSDATGISTDGTGEDANYYSPADSSGAVYLYKKDDMRWKQIAYVKASNSDIGDKFGSSIALSADGATLAVGAKNQDLTVNGVSSNAGAAYIFEFNGLNWIETRILKFNSYLNNLDNFGYSLSLSDDGNSLAVSAPFESYGVIGEHVNGISTGMNTYVPYAYDTGAVLFYEKIEGEWTNTSYIKASFSGSYDYFGYSISLSGDGKTLAVGAIGEDSDYRGTSDDISVANNDSRTDSGAVFVFEKQNSRWVQAQYLKASNAESGDGFGHSVSLNKDGSVMVVGAPKQGVDKQESGAIYVFENMVSGLKQTGYVKASNFDVYDGFGTAVYVSASGEMIAASAYGEDSQYVGLSIDGTGELDNNAAQNGAAYLIKRDAELGWTQYAYIKPANNGLNNHTKKYPVALSGDASTLVIGTPHEDRGCNGVSFGEPDVTCNTGLSEPVELSSGAAFLY